MLTSNKPKVGDGKSSIYFDSDDMEYAKRSGKSKAQKLPKFQKLLKRESSPNLNAKKTWPNFLTLKIKMVFNRL